MVRDVTVRSVVVPLRRPLATKVGDFSRWPLLLIDVTTEQGITGRGYLAPYLTRAAAALRPCSTTWAPRCAVSRAPAEAYKAARGWLGLAGYQGLALAAVAGLDIALWDVLAQAAGLPLAVLLGGTLAPVPAYNSNGLPDPAGASRRRSPGTAGRGRVHRAEDPGRPGPGGRRHRRDPPGQKGGRRRGGAGRGLQPGAEPGPGA